MSENTARLIACIHGTQKLYEEIDKAMIEYFGGNISEHKMSRQLDAAYVQTSKVIQDLLLFSIEENISETDIKQI